MFPKIVNILGLVCLVAVLAAGAAAAYLAIKGTLTGESLKTALAAVTSEPAAAAASQPAGSAEASAEGATANETPDSNASEAAENLKLEMMRRDLANEQALLQAGRVNLQREQEEFEQERTQWKAVREQELVTAHRSGVQKELDYLSSIKPGQALTLLRAKPDDEASRILMAMETRKGKKIIEMCKTADETEWVKRILESDPPAEQYPGAGPDRRLGPASRKTPCWIIV